MDRNISREMSLMRPYVALRKESVDRNAMPTAFDMHSSVALRKESVDRNVGDAKSVGVVTNVALRKESVDRNMVFYADCLKSTCRSPQGERG